MRHLSLDLQNYDSGAGHGSCCKRGWQHAIREELRIVEVVNLNDERISPSRDISNRLYKPPFPLAATRIGPLIDRCLSKVQTDKLRVGIPYLPAQAGLGIRSP